MILGALVIPANAGIQRRVQAPPLRLDSRVRGNDGCGGVDRRARLPWGRPMGAALALLTAFWPGHAGAATTNASARAGLYGWGLGLEVPIVGVLAGAADKSRPGLGYNVGAALSWEVVPGVEARLFGMAGETLGGRARINYLEGSIRRTRRLPANGLDYQLGAGATHLWRGAEPTWAPYVGVDVAYRLAGYSYQFSPDLATLQTFAVAATSPSGCWGTRLLCRSDVNEGTSRGPAVNLRVGVRLFMTSSLATQGELAFTYMRLGAERISNTREARDVREPAENVLLARLNFGIRLGL